MKGCKDNILYEYKTNVLGYQTMKVKQIIIRSKMVKYFKGYSKNQPPKEKKKELLPRFWHFFYFWQTDLAPSLQMLLSKIKLYFFIGFDGYTLPPIWQMSKTFLFFFSEGIP